MFTTSRRNRAHEDVEWMKKVAGLVALITRIQSVVSLYI